MHRLTAERRKTVDNKIKYIVNAVKWFDKINGNTYHSVRVTRCSDRETIVPKMPYEYGHGNQYRYTALKLMADNGWLTDEYSQGDHSSLYAFERENEYPIYWVVSNGLKREMIANGTL